jgi:anti-anti-sigma factor
MASEPTSTGRGRGEAGVFVVCHDIDAARAPELKPQLLQHLQDQGPQIAIDLAEVRFVDSVGLGMLVSVLKAAREAGGGVRLLHPTREVRRVLQITGLEALFDASFVRSP